MFPAAFPEPREQRPHYERRERGAVFGAHDRVVPGQAQPDELVPTRVRVRDPGDALGELGRVQVRQAPLPQAPDRELRRRRLVRAHAPLERRANALADAALQGANLPPAAERVAVDREPLTKTRAVRATAATRPVGLRRVEREKRQSEGLGVARRRLGRRRDGAKDEAKAGPTLRALLDGVRKRSSLRLKRESAAGRRRRRSAFSRFPLRFRRKRRALYKGLLRSTAS